MPGRDAPPAHEAGGGAPWVCKTLAPTRGALMCLVCALLETWLPSPRSPAESRNPEPLPAPPRSVREKVLAPRRRGGARHSRCPPQVKSWGSGRGERRKRKRPAAMSPAGLGGEPGSPRTSPPPEGFPEIGPTGLGPRGDVSGLLRSFLLKDASVQMCLWNSLASRILLGRAPSQACTVSSSGLTPHCPPVTRWGCSQYLRLRLY